MMAGGDVVLIADPDLRDLSAFRSKRVFKAGRGEPGRGSGKHGANGADVELRVPVGTQVLDAGEQVVADLAAPGARVVVAHGGQGGRGNRHFATPTRQTPRFAETGLPGEETELDLRLKLVADAALVGLPNAGKSSLLRRISNAKPKVAAYPFTTVQPVLGTVDSPDGRQLTVADVPGLIEGASRGAGLGHEFLAHLERARLLVHVIDAAAGDATEQFRAIDHELREYGAELDRRSQVVVLNKTDLLLRPPNLRLDDRRIVGVFALSAATGGGVEQFKRALFALVPPMPEPSVDESGMAEFLVYRPRPRVSAYRILRTDRGFRVLGKPPPAEELEAALRAAGARTGSEVEVGDETLVLS
jgi:GTP-binding protein